MRGALFATSVLFILLAGCAGQVTKYSSAPQEEASSVLGKGLGTMQAAASGDASAEGACVALCEAELEKGTDLSAGPCLGNPIAGYADWVCDVAHSPRGATDGLPENQCSAYGEGIAKHFIEVGEDCSAINVR